jgi:CubicO group peptidase (beta-lactamase class C family)
MRFTAFLLFTTLAAAQSAGVAARLEAAANAFAKNRAFTGSVLVAKDNKVILEKGYGMANLELDVPNTPDTKFRLGSITKQFTSAAILQLQEQGKLSVDDAACKFIDSCPAAWKPITVRHLLTHTSGIPSYTAMKGFMTPKFHRIPLTPMETLMLTADKPLDFEPGSRFSYDNSGYIFLGIIIEKVSREDYADYLEKHIFGPLDMQNSGYDQTRTVLKNRASGYSPKTDGFRNADYLDMSLPYAAGALYSTVRDLYRWDRALYTEKVLGKASKEAMWTPGKGNYGFGWTIAPIYKHKQVGHGGGINGFSTYIGRFPDDDAVVIVLSNNEGANAVVLANALAGTLFGAEVKLPESQATKAPAP